MRLGALAAAAVLGAAAFAWWPRLGYVTSGSMAPALRPGDGYVLLRPLRPLRPGDVVVYRPRVLPADLVVHRVVGVTPGGLLTRGDAAPGTDQAAGEPPVPAERVVGVVLAWDGQPVRLPGLQRLSEAARGWVRGLISRPLLLGGTLGAAVLAFGLAAPPGRRWSRGMWRWRAGSAVRGLGGLCAALVVGASLLTGGIRGMEYLVSQSPGDLPNHVKLGEAGRLRLALVNPGFLPVAFVLEGLEGAVAVPGHGVIRPFGQQAVELVLPVQRELGWKRAYVRVSLYPTLLPLEAIRVLHQAHPAAAVAALAALPVVLAEAVVRGLGWHEVPIGRVLGVPRPR